MSISNANSWLYRQFCVAWYRYSFPKMRKNIPLIISTLDMPCKRLLHLVSSRVDEAKRYIVFLFPRRYDYILRDTFAKTGVCNIFLVYGTSYFGRWTGYHFPSCELGFSTILKPKYHQNSN
jgi:hypothetical protein